MKGTKDGEGIFYLSMSNAKYAINMNKDSVHKHKLQLTIA
jgi:hypothetical protein